MTKTIYYAAIAAALLLIFATLYLVWVNRSPKIIGPLLSVSLAAVTAAFITMVIILKPARIVDRFPVSIVIDQKTNLPVMISIENVDKALLQNGLAVRANIEESKPGFQQQRQIIFSNEDEKYAFLTELLQYELLIQCYGIFRYDGEITATSGQAIVRTRIFDDFKPSEFAKLPGDEIARKMSENRFLNRAEKKFWNDEQSWLPIPKRAILSVPDTRTIVIERPSYFKTIVRIEPFAGASGIPPHMVNIINRKDVETRSFVVTLETDFDKFTSESPDTEHNKKWVGYLFPRLRSSMADPVAL